MALTTTAMAMTLIHLDAFRTFCHPTLPKTCSRAEPSHRKVYTLSMFQRSASAEISVGWRAELMKPGPSRVIARSTRPVDFSAVGVCWKGKAQLSSGESPPSSAG